MRVLSVYQLMASVVVVAGCLVLAPWTVGQQTGPATAAPALTPSAVGNGDGAGDSAEPAGEVLRAKVAIVGGGEQAGQWLSLFVSESAKSGLTIDPQSIPGLQIDRVTMENVRALSPFFYLADLVAFGKRQGDVDGDQSVQALANGVQEHIRHVQEMLTQDHQERLQLIQMEMDKLEADRSVTEKRRTELKQQSHGYEAAMKALDDLQNALIGRRTKLIERQARRDVLSKVRERLADERAKAVAGSENHSDADQFVEQQLQELIAIREKQAAAAARIADQGIGPAAEKEDALAQLVDAKLQLAKFKADRKPQSPEVARLDQRLTEVMRDLESAEIEIETEDRVTAALTNELADLRKHLEQTQQALTELEEVNQRLEQLHLSAAELKETLARNRRWTAEGTPVRVRPLNVMPELGGESKR